MLVWGYPVEELCCSQTNARRGRDRRDRSGKSTAAEMRGRYLCWLMEIIEGLISAVFDVFVIDNLDVSR